MKGRSIVTGSSCRVAVLILLVLFCAFQECQGEESDSPEIIVMVSSVFGSPDPGQEKQQTIPNGEFEIIRNTFKDERVEIVGNGLDEFTLWTFDFTDHPQVEEALSCVKRKPKFIITEARLTLVVKPMAYSAKTDAVYIQGSACNHTTQKHFNPPGYSELEPHRIQVVDYDLIQSGHYWPNELHHYLRLTHPVENTAQKSKGYAFCAFDKSEPGQLPMLIRDDSIISQATLTLRFIRNLRNGPGDRPGDHGEGTDYSCSQSTLASVAPQDPDHNP